MNYTAHLRQSRPSWLKKKPPEAGAAKAVSAYLKERSIETVCTNSRCPNIGECYSAGNVTFLILGNRCSRNCLFCAIQKGAPEKVDENEPEAIASAVKELHLRYAVITSVTRDDLPDGGVRHYADVVRAVKRISGKTVIEVLTPDFKGSRTSIDAVMEAGVDVFTHNMETVPRLYNKIKPDSDYHRSLDVLRYAVSFKKAFIKSGFMVGMGETDEEVRRLLIDIRKTGCVFLTVGQYLKPRNSPLEVERYVSPGNFEKLRLDAIGMGFKKVASGPFIRSSYRAESFFISAT